MVAGPSSMKCQHRSFGVVGHGRRAGHGGRVSCALGSAALWTAACVLPEVSPLPTPSDAADAVSPQTEQVSEAARAQGRVAPSTVGASDAGQLKRQPSAAMPEENSQAATPTAETSNGCSSDNGGCEQRCVPSDQGDGHRCECEPGAALKSNGKDCWSWQESAVVNTMRGPLPGATPVVSFDANDGALLVWSQWSNQTEGARFWSRRKLVGADWARELTFSVPSPPQTRSMFLGTFAQSANGSALAMWTEYSHDSNTGTSIYPCVMSHFGEQDGWSSPLRVADYCTSWGSAIAANADGDFVLGYYDDHEASAQLVVAPYFSQQLGSTHVVSSGTKLSLDQSQLVLSMQDDRSITAVYFAGESNRALYVAEANGGGEWAATKYIAPVAPCEIQSDCNMTARFNHNGDGVIVWQQAEGDPDDWQRSLWSAARTKGTWSNTTKVTPELTYVGVDLAINERGDALLGYRVRRAVDLPIELRIRRFSADSGWQDEEKPLGESTVGQVLVGIFEDGHAIAAWNVYSATVPGSYDIWTTQSTEQGWSQPVLLGAGAFLAGSEGFSLAVGRSLAMVTWHDTTTHDVRVRQLD
jgi:hypothetical protein